jgi:hypothetical protein
MRAMTRRGVLAGCSTSVLARPARSAVPEAGRLAFRVFRNDSPLGTHSLVFQRRGEVVSVAIAVDYVVRIGPIPVFRYTLRGSETWRGDTLVSVQAETNDDGETARMSATEAGGRLAVDGSKSGRYLAPPGAIAATHWNRREIEAPMINPQNGELLEFAVVRGGSEMVALASGRTVPAQRFALTGPSVLDLWYEPDGTWAALRAVARDGSVITYRRE